MASRLARIIFSSLMLDLNKNSLAFNKIGRWSRPPFQFKIISHDAMLDLQTCEM